MWVKCGVNRWTARGGPSIQLVIEIWNGGRGIRTPGTVPRTAVFKTAGFNRSPIPPMSILTDFLDLQTAVLPFWDPPHTLFARASADALISSRIVGFVFAAQWAVSEQRKFHVCVDSGRLVRLHLGLNANPPK